MTALIGVMILVLIGILLTTIITQAVVVLADPNTKQIVSVLESKVDGFPEEKAFPHAPEDQKEPVYLEVWKDRVVIHPRVSDTDEISQRELRQKENALTRKIDEVAKEATDFYFVLVIRPGAAQMGRMIRDQLRNRGVDVGVDLFESTRPLTHVSQTINDRRTIIERRKTNPNAGRALSTPTPAPGP
jgi:hypothetical protein